MLHAGEVGLHLNPKIGRDWMLPGVQRQVLTPRRNEERCLGGRFQVERRLLLAA